MSYLSLVGLYVALQLVADVAATKFLQVGPFAMPAGTFIFALTFTVRDMLHRQHGKKVAQKAIITAVAGNILLAAYLWVMSRLPSAPFFAFTEEWSAIFAIVPAITIASILAELVSELMDTEVYTRVGPAWAAVFLSNTVGLLLDSLLFSVLAFVVLPMVFGGQVQSLFNALSLTWGQTVFKMAITILSIPLIYLVRRE